MRFDNLLDDLGQIAQVYDIQNMNSLLEAEYDGVMARLFKKIGLVETFYITVFQMNVYWPPQCSCGMLIFSEQ